LATIDYNRPFTLQTDASAFAIGATLTQKQEDGTEKPVAFFSASLQPAEINYDIFDRELLAIVKSFRHWRQHLLGARHQITVLTDHNNLSYFREPHKISGRQARWMETLADYDFKLQHIPGHTNTVADLLSRRPDHKEGVNDVNNETVVLPDHLFVNKIILTNDDERRHAVYELHDTPIAGHPGIANTWALVNERYEGQGLKQFIEQYVKGCPTCQSVKAQRGQAKAPTQYINTPVEEGPFQYVSMDLITDLPKSGNYDAILTIVDQGCSKATKFIPCTKTITGQGVAALYVRYLLPWFGIPKRIISDRDPRFTSTFSKEICKQTGIQQNLSTAFHPQTDGQTERMNLWIEQYLKPFVKAQGQDNWVEYLPIAEFAHNSWPHDITKKSPHELLIGMKPQVHVMPMEEGSSPMATERLINLQEARVHAAEAFLKRYKRREPRMQFEEGQRVWLEGKNLSFKIPTRKLAPRRYGPFTIVKKISSVAYQLDLPTHMKIHDVFHIDLLTPYKETEQYGPAYTPPPPDIIDGHEEQEVEAILDVRRKGQNRNWQYLIKWKGYPSSENEWVDSQEMHADDLVKQFHATRLEKDKRRRR
jgi:hypothetical protein